MLTTAVTLPPARIGARRPGPGRSFYSLPMQATDLQKELAATVRKFVKTELPNSLVEKIDREDKAPTRELFAKMGELGLHGVMAHPDYGGLGLGYTEHCLIVEQLSRGCPAIGLAYGAHSNLCMSQIIRNGSAAQKKRFLPKLISGEAVGALAITEPDAGTDAFAMRTTARKAADGSHYVLNGTKTFITNAGVADTYVVYAKTRPDLGHNGVSCFVVEKGAPGLSFGPKFEKLGMRGCETRQVIFENCKVPAANLISQENKGNMAMKLGLNSERLVLSAGPLG